MLILAIFKENLLKNTFMAGVGECFRRNEKIRIVRLNSRNAVSDGR